MFPILGLSLLNLLMLFGLGKEFFWRQLFFWLLGLGALFLAKLISSKNIFALGKKIYFFSLFLLILPLFFGSIVRGSLRWIAVSGFSIQPSEIAKPFLIGFFAWQLSQKGIEKLKDFLLFFGAALIPSLLILFQPDLGSAGVVFLVLMLFIFIGKPKLSWWLPLITASVLIFLIGRNSFFHPYQLERIENFLNPGKDPLGKGYHLIQAQLAVGSGGLFGRGFGLGRQTQLKFLPEKHTDFILAAIGEELGFLGIFFSLGLYFWFFSWLLKKISLAKDSFNYFFGLGIFFLLFLQTSLNIAMNLQLFPIVGLPLPLLSYGGSSLISILFSLGLFLS